MEKQDGDSDVSCSFCGKGRDEVRKIAAGPKVFICDECVDLCNEIFDEETEVPDARLIDHTVEAAGGGFVTRPQVVIRYTSEPVTIVAGAGLDGVHWLCEGCGWRIKLPPGATPPAEHSEQITIALWPDAPGELPARELVPNCADSAWLKLG